MTRFVAGHNSKGREAGGDGLARRLELLAVLCLLAGSLALQQRVMAQSDTGLWATPVNISKSGGGSQPVIAAEPDGTLHALWWDSQEGEKYSQTTSATGLSWTEPITVVQIYGRRKTAPDPETGKLRLVLDQPLDLRLLSDSKGKVYALWHDVQNQLSAAQWDGSQWGAAAVVGDSIVTADAASDSQGSVHLAYIRSQNSADVPSGVYYRAASSGIWSKPSLVYASLYFRTVKPEAAHVSLASDGSGQVVVSWDDPELGQGVYARSSDNGLTWSSPQSVSTSAASQAVEPSVAFAPNSGFLLIWKDAGVAGCELRWQRSADGGQTWSEAGPLYSDIDACPQHLRFPLEGDSQVWLLGLLSAGQSVTGGGRMALAAWDGGRWSPSVEANLDFKHPLQKNKELLLNNLDLAIAGQTLGIVGTDDEGDIWAVRNVAAPKALVSALVPVWDVPQVVSSDQTSAQVKDAPALATDPQGRLYALWSETTDPHAPGSSLYLAAKDQGRWSRAIPLFQSVGAPTEATTGTVSSPLAEEPDLAVDSESRLQAVWRGGADAAILYSWTFATDFASSSTWTKPIALPMPGRPGSWPEVVVDPISHTLHVIFAIPFNEGRGIYDVQSNDGGSSWAAPAVVFDAAAAKWDSVDKPRLALDTATGVLHAVWLQTGLIGEAYGRAVVYAQSADGGQSWSGPTLRAAATSDWPRLAVARPNQVYVVWNQPATGADASTALAEVWGQVSSDGGQSWTAPVPISGFEVTGPVDLVPDGAGGLYLVGMGQSATGGATLINAYWDGQAWSKAETYDLGYDAAPGNAVTAAYLPASHRLEAALQALTGTSSSDGRFSLLVAGRQAQATVAVPLAPTLTAPPSPTPTATPRPLPTATAAVTPTLNPAGSIPPANPSPLPVSTTLVAGGVLILLFVSGLVIFTLVRMVRR